MKSFISISLLAILFLVSCNQQQKSPLYNEVLNDDNLIELTTKIKNDDMMSHEEIQLFTNGLARMITNNDSIASKTIAEVIKYQEDYLRENAVNNMVFNVNRLKMLEALNLKYLGMQPRDTAGQNLNIIVCEVTNNTDQPITKLDGYLTFYNRQNQVVKRYNITTKDKIEPGTKRLIMPFVHEPENQRDVIMRTNNTLRPIWNPNTVVLEDGTEYTIIKEDEKKEESK